MTHYDDQRVSVAKLTFQQWFQGRAAHLRANPNVGADAGEQAMRADYVADKAWWYRTYEPKEYASFSQATEAAQVELPPSIPKPQPSSSAWLGRLDSEIARAARSVPSSQWSTTLIPQSITNRIWGCE